MFGYYISAATGRYYEGYKTAEADVEVARQPSQYHVWQDEAWVLDMAALQARGRTDIDDAAEALRCLYITPGSGQAMSYQNKIRVAGAWDAAGNPADLTGFPNIAAEVGISAADAAGVVQLWRDKNAEWQQLDAAIEAARLGAKKTVDDQTDPETAADAIDAAVSMALATFAAMRPA